MPSLPYKEIIDISMPLEKGMMIYPNNPEFRATKVKGSSSLLHKVSMGTHTGSHIDAPNHSIENAPGVDFFPLNDFIGPCRVIDCTEVEHVIEVADIQDAVIHKGDRILLKTKNSEREESDFFEDFVALSPAAAEYLAGLDISLVGIDFLSIKKKGAEENTAHTAFLSRGIPILEGIALKGVKPGLYTLVALPLKFKGLDGAPVRAVLLR